MRLFLKQVFRYDSYSLYNDTSDIGKVREVADYVGHKNYENNWPDFYAKIVRSEKKFFVKTHDYPSDDFPAIYIVRDGRSAIVSYWHYLREIEGQKEVTLNQVIKGNVPFGSWSEHAIRWNANRRPNTLLIKYEDINNERDSVMSRLSIFIGEEPKKHVFVDQFVSLQKKFPKFFRVGSNEKNTADLASENLAVFWSEHADQMVRLGYVNEAERIESENKFTASEVARLVADRDRQASEVARLVADRDRQASEVARLVAECDHQQSEMVRLRSERDNFHQLTVSLYNSTSWKITARLRKLKFWK